MTLRDFVLSDSYRSYRDLAEKATSSSELVPAFFASGLHMPPAVKLPTEDHLTVLAFDGEHFTYDGTQSPETDLNTFVETASRVFNNCIRFDSSFDALPDVETMGDTMLVVGNRLHMGHVDHRFILVGHFWGWLDEAREYLLNPTDFLSSYCFVTGHPAFWYKHHQDDERWNTNYSGFWHTAVYSDTRPTGVVHMMEAGATVPGTSHHYRDTRMDVWADTYEDAIVQLAAKVDKTFDLDGTDNEYDKETSTDD